MPFGVFVPYFLPRRALEDLHHRGDQVVEEVSPDEELGECKRLSFDCWRKYPQIQEQNRQLRDEDERCVHDLRRVRELSNYQRGLLSRYPFYSPWNTPPDQNQIYPIDGLHSRVGRL